MKRGGKGGLEGGSVKAKGKVYGKGQGEVK